VLLLDDSAISEYGLHVHTIVHGVVSLDQLNPEYGGDRRRLRVSKYRGRRFRGGYHDYHILTGGLRVFPRLVAAEYRRDSMHETVSSGLPALDSLLGGGLDRGTSTLVVGAAGTGKSSLVTHFMMEAANRGERSVLFAFDESIHSLLTRSQGIGFRLQEHVESGMIQLQAVDPAELLPGEFAQAIRDAVENDGVRFVAIDSLNGYLNAMPEERFMIVQLHELLTYLGQMGVVTLLVSTQPGLIGPMAQGVDVSYIADGVILLRYFEAAGEVRQAISVLKKRTGLHERTIREMIVSRNGIAIGDPLREFQGILTGVPQERQVMAEHRIKLQDDPAHGAAGA
jgi:circadian clock protein KaiC